MCDCVIMGCEWFADNAFWCCVLPLTFSRCSGQFAPRCQFSAHSIWRLNGILRTATSRGPFGSRWGGGGGAETGANYHLYKYSPLDFKYNASQSDMWEETNDDCWIEKQRIHAIPTSGGYWDLRLAGGDRGSLKMADSNRKSAANSREEVIGNKFDDKLQ